MRHRRRGEAQVEYAIIGIVVTSCAVTGLLVAGAGGLRRVADASQLCVVEAGECDKVETGEHGPPTPGDGAEQPDGADADSESQDGDADAQGADETSPTGEDELLGPRVEKLNPDGTIKDGSEPTEAELPQLGPVTVTPPPPAVDPFGLKSWFSSALNTGYGQSLYQGFKGIFGFFSR